MKIKMHGMNNIKLNFCSFFSLLMLTSFSICVNWVYLSIITFFLLIGLAILSCCQTVTMYNYIKPFNMP